MSASPNSLASFSLISQATGGVTSAASSYHGAKSQKSSAKFQARISDLNAQISESSAQQELLKGNQQIGALTLQAGQLKSKQRVALSANGVDLGEGSAAEQLASSDIMKDIDMTTLRANAVRSAWGYRTEANNHKIQATSYRVAADGISPGMGAFTSLLGTASGLAKSWSEFKQAGMFEGDGSKSQKSSSAGGSSSAMVKSMGNEKTVKVSTAKMPTVKVSTPVVSTKSSTSSKKSVNTKASTDTKTRTSAKKRSRAK